MANSIGFLKGLISLGQLAFESNIPISTLRGYQAGRFAPSAARLLGLQKIYSSIQLTRLKQTGFSHFSAKIHSVKSQRSVSRQINSMSAFVSNTAKKAKVQESAIRANTRRSKDPEPWNYAGL